MTAKGLHLHVDLSASQVRKRLKGHGFGVKRVESAGKNQAVIVHTATGQHLRQLESLFHRCDQTGDRRGCGRIGNVECAGKNRAATHDRKSGSLNQDDNKQPTRHSRVGFSLNGLDPTANMNPMNNTHLKSIGYVLWLFGFTGSHRFYYGKQITGTIWFFTFGVFLIGWIVDLFLIPSMDRQADRRFHEGRLDYTVAWILLTFLGLFGIHRFYMGKVVTGIIYLLTGGLLGIGWLYDLWTLNEQVDAINRGL